MPHSRISIRRATEADARAISALIRRNADAVLSEIYTLQQLRAWKQYNTPARLRRRMAERIIFCAFASDRLCATIALQDDELAGLYVAPHRRSAGIGGKLLAHLEAFAARRGIFRLRLTSAPSATEFYKHHGWKAGRKVLLNILGVDFEETSMTKP